MLNDSEPEKIEATEENEKQDIKLGTMTNVEAVVNEYAKSICEKYKVGKNEFRIVLMSQMRRGNMGITPGPVVEIALLWPDTQPVINLMLRSAFNTIRRMSLVRPVSIEKYSYMSVIRNEHRKFVKEKFGDKAELLPDMLQSHRISYTVKTVTTVTARDIVTGETLSLSSDTDKFKTEWEAQEKLRIALSRVVRDKYMVDDVDDKTSEDGKNG